MTILKVFAGDLPACTSLTRKGARQAPSLAWCCYRVSVDSIVVLLPHGAHSFFFVRHVVLSMFFLSMTHALTVGMQICFGSSLKASKHGTVICLGVCARWWHLIVCASFGQCCFRVSVSGRVFMLLIRVIQCWHWEPFHFHCV